MQSIKDYPYVLDAARKQQYLDLYRATHKSKATAESLGISYHTIAHHLRIDPVFARRYKDAQDEIAEELQDMSVSVGLTERGFMDRCMQLRRLRPADYAPDNNRAAQAPQIVLNIGNDAIARSAGRDQTIEAQIVGETAGLVAPMDTTMGSPRRTDAVPQNYAERSDGGEAGA